MSIQRINRAKERQIGIKADTEEVKIDIEIEKFNQAKIQLATERINTNTAYIRQDIAQLKQDQSLVLRDTEVLNLGLINEAFNFTKRDLELTKEENRLKIDSKQINIASLRESNTHQTRLLGGKSELTL
jgi:hypothetical protein